MVFGEVTAARLQAVLFDWAGTTIDYGCRAPTEVFRNVFAQSGVEITVEEARGPMGMYKKDHIRALTQMPGVAARWHAVHGRNPDESDVDRLYGIFEPQMWASLTQHADVIPGTIETVQWLRARGTRIGSSTGYTAGMMELLTAVVRANGYEPDVVVTISDVPAGRPAPWMCLECAKRLNAYPLESVVTVDDTPVGMEAGLNAGTWTVGVVRSGNEIGLSESELQQVDEADLRQRLERGARRLASAGAHFVIDSIADLPKCIEEIERRLALGEKP